MLTVTMNITINCYGNNKNDDNNDKDDNDRDDK